MLNFIQHACSWLIVLLTGSGGTFLLVQIAKRLNAFNLSGASAIALRSMSGVLSLAAVVLLGFANHDVQPTDLGHILLAVLTAVSTWLGSHQLHSLNKALSPKPADAGDMSGGTGNGGGA